MCECCRARFVGLGFFSELREKIGGFCGTGGAVFRGSLPQVNGLFDTTTWPIGTFLETHLGLLDCNKRWIII